jgi:hypothetical protein
MAKYIQVGLILLGLVVLDASGDAMRILGWQIPSHAMETIQIAGWILIWALYGFKRYYVAMYILARIWAFDIVLNLWTGFRLLYVSDNDLVGLAILWFADLVHQPYVHFSFILKFITLVWWIAWLLSDGDHRALYWWKRKA